MVGISLPLKIDPLFFSLQFLILIASSPSNVYKCTHCSKMFMVLAALHLPNERENNSPHIFCWTKN